MVRKIVLSIGAVLLAVGFSIGQNRQITGTVTGADGSPVSGATVAVEGAAHGTTTNSDGSFTLSAPADGSLVVSFIGYEDAVVAVNGRTHVDVVLQEKTHGIDDVIVVAFGEAKKDAFTGSAKVLKADDLIKTQTSNVTNALVGKVAGAQFTSASGRPGEGQSILIRGLGSINAGNSPLWIVDGAPYEGDINNINSADIESITVLKDAASNALYGARGANGVIMVTTKRARVGDAHVTFDAKWGVNTKALQTYDIAESAGEYYEMHYNALYNYFMDQNPNPQAANVLANERLTSNEAGGLGYNVFTVPDGQRIIGLNGKLNPNAREGHVVTGPDGKQYLLKADNWLDELYHSSFRQEYNVSVSAATDKANFYGSLGYLENNGIISGSSMDRLTARLRADYQAKKWLKVGGNMGYTHFHWKNGMDIDQEGASDGGNAFATAIQTAPVYPVYIRDADGNIMIDKYGLQMYDCGDGRNGGAVRSNGGSSNDLQDLKLNKYLNEGNALSASGFADFTFYKGLTLTINGSLNLDETRSTTMNNPFYGQFATSGGLISKGHSRDISYNLQQLLNYRNTFADKHNIDLLLGHEMYNHKIYGLSAYRMSMFSPDNLELNGAATDGKNSASSVSEYNNEGYFFRAQYDYDNRIFLSGSYRRDASSRFHPDHRWGNFWSVGAAWIINRESWFNAPWVDILKIKASYGSQGNDNISDYLYVDMYSISSDGQGGATTLFARKGNPEITWETNTNLNVGVEFAFWNSRLYGSVEYFNRKTTDMLFSLPVPPELGYSSKYVNVGDMVNRGVEIELGADLIRSKNVVWDFNLNLTHYKNKLVKLPDEYKTNTSADGKHTGLIDGSYFREEGSSFYTRYLPSYAGVSDRGESQWYTYNAAGERVVTTDYQEAVTNGRELQGDALPDVYGGFGTSVRFYGVDLSVNFAYQIGGEVLDSGYMYYMSSPQGTTTNNYHRDLLKAWSEDNRDSDIPRFVYGDPYSASSSDRFLTDASYLNIQNITLGYTLPRRITSKFLVDALRIYVTCDNVWYWSRRQGLDPRQSVSGATNPFYYAPIRTISGGISITF